MYIDITVIHNDAFSFRVCEFADRADAIAELQHKEYEYGSYRSADRSRPELLEYLLPKMSEYFQHFAVSFEKVL